MTANVQVAAFHNRMFVAAACRCGEERGVRWTGGSVIAGPDGYPLAGPASSSADQGARQEILIATLRQQSLDRFKNVRDSIKGRIDNLTNVIAEWDKKALSLSERLAEYNRIKGDFDRTKGLYDRLVNNLHEVDISRNVDQDLISIAVKIVPLSRTMKEQIIHIRSWAFERAVRASPQPR